MDQLKRVSAVLGAAFGSLAMLYLVFACSLTLKNFGLSVKAQLITQRILTPLLFVSARYHPIAGNPISAIRSKPNKKRPSGTRSEGLMKA